MSLQSGNSFYELPVFDLHSGKRAGHAELNSAVFGHVPRADIISRVVRWQTEKHHQGTKATLSRSEVSRTGKKMYKQKGTGRARHSTAKAPQFRGGGRAFGGVAVYAESQLPKKVRSLGLLHALSSKALEGELILVQNLAITEHKTKSGKEALRRLGVAGKRCLIVYGDTIDLNLALATRNIPEVDLLPAGGLNVYDVLNHSRLLLSREAVDYLDGRFLGKTLWHADPYGVPESVLVPSVPRKGSKAKLEQSLSGDNSAPSEIFAKARVLLALESPDIEKRREAMKKLVADPSKFNKSDLKARFLPLLLSSNHKEAREAAVTLAKLIYPEHYSSLIGSADDQEKALLERVRHDVESVLKEEGVICFTYAEALGRKGDEVTVEVRLSPEMPFQLDGQPARVKNPAWEGRKPNFDVVVTGADDATLNWSSDKGTNHAKAVLKFKAPGKGAMKLFLDFFADNRWISRRELMV